MVAEVLEWVFWAVVMGCVPIALYVVAQISRRQREEMLRPNFNADSLRRLDSMLRARRQLMAPAAPFALLTGPQATEVHGLRLCGFTWYELVAWAPMWGLDARAVAAERDRIEEALRG